MTPLNAKNKPFFPAGAVLTHSGNEKRHCGAMHRMQRGSRLPAQP